MESWRALIRGVLGASRYLSNFEEALGERRVISQRSVDLIVEAEPLGSRAFCPAWP
jgi:hypothetical protein